MGYQELIEALRKEEEEKVKAIRLEAEERIEKIREEARRKIGDLHERHRRIYSGEKEAAKEAAASRAEKKAKALILSAEKELSDRLYSHALASLPLLRREEYGRAFAGLAGEIPSHPWQIVRVKPEDAELARRNFPGSEIESDPAITGGLEVMEQDGSVQVINTFEKRIENAWAEILPALIKDVCRTAREN